MPEKTEAQKKAQKKYMEKFMVAQIRMARDKYKRVQAHAEAHCQSVNAYINAAIDDRMAQDDPQEAGVVSLPPDTLKAAQKAAQAAGEGLPQFIGRAVTTQAQWDALGRKMKGGKPNE